MKAVVALENIRERAGPVAVMGLHVVAQPFQFVDLGACQILGRAGGPIALQQGPQLEGILDLTLVQLAYDGRAVGQAYHQSLDVKLHQGLADGRTADLQPRGQHRLRDAHPTGQTTVHDHLAQLVTDAFGYLALGHHYLVPAVAQPPDR